MIRLKVSYEDPGELVDFVTMLGDKVVRLKSAKEQKGKYKRAYIDIKTGNSPRKMATKKG